MKVDQFLSNPENRAAVQMISQQAVATLAPGQVKRSERFMEPLLEILARGEELNSETSEKEMGLGVADDMIVLVVIPVLVPVLTALITKLGIETIEALKQLFKKDDKPAKTLIKITVDDVELVVSRTKFAGNKKKIKELTEALNTALIDYLAK